MARSFATSAALRVHHPVVPHARIDIQFNVDTGIVKSFAQRVESSRTTSSLPTITSAGGIRTSCSCEAKIGDAQDVLWIWCQLYPGPPKAKSVSIRGQMPSAASAIDIYTMTPTK